MKVVPLTLRQANDFVVEHHRHSGRTAGNSGRFAIGLEQDGVLVGIAIVGRPIARMLAAPRTAELLRCCVSLDAPRCATSKLNSRAKRIWQLMGGDRLITYTLQSESGDSLRGAGFKADGDIRTEAWNRPSRQRKGRRIESAPKQRWSAQLDRVPT